MKDIEVINYTLDTVREVMGFARFPDNILEQVREKASKKMDEKNKETYGNSSLSQVVKTDKAEKKDVKKS